MMKRSRLIVRRLLALLVVFNLFLGVSLSVSAENCFSETVTGGTDSEWKQTGIESGSADCKTVSILSDSLGTYQGYSRGENYYYYSPQYMSVSDTWWMRYIKNNNLRLGVNESLSSSKVSWKEGDRWGIEDCMASQERINRLGENGTPDIILFFGGTNDVNAEMGSFLPNENIGDVSTFYSAYQTAVVRLKNTYPNAEIICIMPYYRDITIYSSANYMDDAKIDRICKAISDVCSYYGVYCVDLRQAGIDRYEDMCTPDYYHVNEKGAYKIWKAIEEKCGDVLIKVDNICWNYKDTSIDIGASYRSMDNGTVFRWQSYNLDTGQWETIADWNGGNWASWTPKKGNYWLQVQAKTTGGTVAAKTIGFTVGRNYPVYITGTYQGPNPYGNGCLIGVSTNSNPKGRYQYELLILDCEKYQNGDPNPWVYGSERNYIAGTSFWTTYQPAHNGWYWTYFRIYDEKGNMVEDRCYGAYL